MAHPTFPLSFGCRLVVWVLVTAPMISAGQILSAAQAAAPADFEREVAPLLIRRCLECHQSANASGGLSLQSRAEFIHGGDSGGLIADTAPSDSLLLQRVRVGEMPPLKHGESQKLPESEIQILTRWMDAGAPFPADRRLDLYEQTSDVRGGRDWWSFQPLMQTTPPQSAHLPGHANPIDQWIAQSLQRHGLTPAPPADPETLVRRLYWDITGLPATADAVKIIVESENRRDAINRLIDSLLESPQFGERWARHWLDIVRFAETCGYERDQLKPFAWKYRDWVVNAFNTDMPYDQFIREQLAGDELPNRTEQSVIATGFLCLGTWNDEPNDAEDYKYERLEDLVHTTSSAFLGMTTKCARCHDHKFDPIPQTDYYRMAAAFWPGPIQPRDRALIGGPSAEELGFVDVLGWTDVTKTPTPLHKLKNGERNFPLEPVTAAALSCVPAEFREFTPLPDTARTTGLRLQLAEWMTSPRNPLTARVIVNRLWQHHFGEGLVRSTNNFGYTGDKPTHPELLDWLAGELIRSNWSLRHIHRLILTSATWQQASLHPLQDQYNQTDAANRFLWRAHRRRKEAESLRDAFLASTGELDLRLGGPSFYPTISPDALEGLSRKTAAGTSPDSEQRRRSLYMFTQRSLLPPLMTTFDMCDSTLSCGQRDVTIVAPQALTLLNNDFIHQRTEALATKLLDAEAKVSPAAIEAAWLSILNRRPSPEELSLSMVHIISQTARFAVEQSVEAKPGHDHQADVKRLLDSAVLFLDAAAGVTVDASGHLERWKNQTAAAHEAHQPDAARRPLLIRKADHGGPALRFNGAGSFLHLTGPLLKDDEVTVFAIVTDTATAGHRELLSNWSGKDGNSGTSFFIGMTDENAVRLSDAISGVGRINNRQQLYLLTATNGHEGAAVFQQKRTVVEQPTPLPSRRLETPWVIGQQGNIDGEYWQGDVALLIVIDRQLSREQRALVQDFLIQKYNLPKTDEPAPTPESPEHLALASLCLVLFNSNEFAYVD